jgi:hypothetical protein
VAAGSLHLGVRRGPEQVAPREDADLGAPAWDVVVLDEGHRAKNPAAKTYAALVALRARMRVVATGTPVQNNLLELHALLDLACPGLLAPRRDFKRDIAAGIEAGQVCRSPQREQAMHAAGACCRSGIRLQREVAAPLAAAAVAPASALPLVQGFAARSC